MSGEKKYRAIRIRAGTPGWGGPLIIEPKPGKDLIYCVTGGGIHPVAQRIAELTGGTAIDGFKGKREFEEIAVAVIDCGGAARIGVYPMKGVLTVDVHGTEPSGPLFRFIKKEIFVSGVTEKEIELLEEGSSPLGEAKGGSGDDAEKRDDDNVSAADTTDSTRKSGFLKRLFGGN